jgi:hypothetical protein
MPEKLYEADFEFVDINAILNGKVDTSKPSFDEPEETEEPNTATVAQNNGKETLPKAGAWDNWGRLLKRRIAQNNEATSNKKSQYEVENTFFEEFFKANWEADIAAKLIDIGEPLRKILKVLGFRVENSMLIFITLDFTKELLRSGKLNVLTFKAIYNALAKKLVVDSEFRKQNKYNIIYCKDLYNRSPKEMEQYLEIQSGILKASSATYDATTQVYNKRVFYHFDVIKETEPSKYIATVTNKENPRPGSKLIAVSPIADLKLNSIQVADKIYRLMSGESGNEKVTLDNQKVAAIGNEIKSIPQAYATLLTLYVKSNSQEARKAMALPYFSRIGVEELNSAVLALAKSNILPEGQIQTDSADALVNNIVAKLSQV